MSINGAQVEVFFREVTEGGSVWTVDNGAGLPVAANPEGRHVIPFWSLESRAAELTPEGSRYAGFEVREIPLAEWTSGWLPGLRGDGMLVGLNWTAEAASGFDAEPDTILARLAG